MTKTTKKTAKSTELIKAAAIFRCTSKETGKCVGYLVPSNTTRGVCYQITWNAEQHSLQCNCKATKECCHIKAVKEVCALRRERNAACCEECQAEATTTSVGPALPVVEAEIEAALPALVLAETITYVSEDRRTVQRGLGELEPQYRDGDAWLPWSAEPGTTRTVRFHAESSEERAACEVFMAATSDEERAAILKRVWDGRFAVLNAIDAARATAPLHSRAFSLFR